MGMAYNDAALLMGIECLETHSGCETMDKLSVPSGFKSRTSFTLKKVENRENNSTGFTNVSVPEAAERSTTSTVAPEICLSKKPWIISDQCNQDSERSPAEQLTKSVPPKSSLPKGVLRGCSDCSNCQKITANWQPRKVVINVLEEAPVFYPTVEEFCDTVKYIASIRPKVEEYGICRIVPPQTWKAPSFIMEEGFWDRRFQSYVQQIDKLQNGCMRRHMPCAVDNTREKEKRSDQMDLEGDFCLKDADESGCNENKLFKHEIGPTFSLSAFKKYAKEFQSLYFHDKDVLASPMVYNPAFKKQGVPSVENIEGEYWRIVENPTEEIEVLYGVQLASGIFGGGFPLEPIDSNIAKESGWNLNKLPKLPGSLLSFESFSRSAVLVPQVHVGMCFSSFCWQVEEHHLYLLSYMHFGSPKVCYGIPGRCSFKFEAALKKHVPDLLVQKPQSWHKQVKQLPLSALKSYGIPVYRCVQHPREFILTLPGAYHSGFDCGFNFVEEVNYAPIDWLPFGQNTVELYQEQLRETKISYDRMLLGAAREAVRAQWELSLLMKKTPDNLRWKDSFSKDSILVKALKSRVKLESRRRDYLSISSQSCKMDELFDATSKRECCICLYDLHLSAVGCKCCPDKYACLVHGKQLCPCPWSAKQFLFRYEIKELNALIKALEGKLGTAYRWANELGLRLPNISRYISHEPELNGHSSSAAMSNSKKHKFQSAAITKEIGHSTLDGNSEMRASLLCRPSIELNNPTSTCCLDVTAAEIAPFSKKRKTFEVTPGNTVETCISKSGKVTTYVGTQRRSKEALLSSFYPRTITPNLPKAVTRGKFQNDSIRHGKEGSPNPTKGALPGKKALEKAATQNLPSNVIVLSDDEDDGK
ncbi:JmjN domain [Dillenia turbinata]|uniref:JmjN domain n=1 Tax=Dillenia turbinata TaxID=194707 RepID=A0AAN8W2R5_9MAGN